MELGLDLDSRSGREVNSASSVVVKRLVQQYNDRPYLLGGGFNINADEAKVPTTATELQWIYDVAQH